MTAPLLHRYCPDHTPERALCGLDLVTACAEPVDPGAIEERDECLVCADLAPMPCQDACRALRPEPKKSAGTHRADPPGGASGPAGRRPSPGGPLLGGAGLPAPAPSGNTAGGES